MKYMLIRKADTTTEQGTLPSDEVYQAMADYNERMLQAGVFLFGNGLRPTNEGCRLDFRDGEADVSRGPFEPAEDQLAGYSVLEVDSLEDAIHWAEQWPREDAGGNVTLELRRYFDIEDVPAGHSRDQHRRQTQLPLEMNIHASFPGNCREAMTFYKDITGGHLETMLTFGETPAAAETPPELHDHIIHASLNIRGRRLMGADMAGDCHQPVQGAAVHLEYESPQQAEQVFDQLRQDGQIIMPFEETFWAQRFGMTTDRFGISWMISCGTRRCPPTAADERSLS